MIKPIYLYGSEVLRQKAQEVDLTDKQGIAGLVADLKETLASSEGCGLAAPQIGVSSRVLVVDGREVADNYPYLSDFYRVMINPVELEASNATCEYSEGCLSVPGIYSDVRRPSSIKVGYYNEQLEYVEEAFDKFGCRIVQHEMSHLEGIVFTDLVAPIRRKMLAKKLQAIAKGHVSTHYRSKIK